MTFTVTAMSSELTDCITSEYTLFAYSSHDYLFVFCCFVSVLIFVIVIVVGLSFFSSAFGSAFGSAFCCCLSSLSD